MATIENLCPDCHVGVLSTYKTKRRSTGTLERSRECSCCGRREVAILRPVEIIKIRCIRRGVGTDPKGIPPIKPEQDN